MGFPFLSLLTHTEVKKLNGDSSSRGHLQFLLRLHQHEEYPMEGILLGDKARHSKRVGDVFLDQFLPAATSFLTFVSLSSATFKVHYIV